MSVNENNREQKFNLWGWIMFLVCACFFIASAVDTENIWGLVGSIIFLVGCIIFIIPLVRQKKQD